MKTKDEQRTQEILRKVRKLEIMSRTQVESILSGQYHSRFKGQGMQFADLREYAAGDDVRHIDWKVTARTQNAHIKKFEEERERTVYIAFDVSRSGTLVMGRGGASQTKREILAEICALLMFSAVKNNDKVGLILFSDRIEKHIPPRKGRVHALRLLTELLYFEPEGRGTSLRGLLEFCSKILKGKCILFLASDFYDKDFELPFKQVTRRHELVGLTLDDPREDELMQWGACDVMGLESLQNVFLSAKDVKGSPRGTVLSRTMSLFQKYRADLLAFRSEDDPVHKLRRFFHSRKAGKASRVAVGHGRRGVASFAIAFILFLGWGGSLLHSAERVVPRGHSGQSGQALRSVTLQLREPPGEVHLGDSIEAEVELQQGETFSPSEKVPCPIMDQKEASEKDVRAPSEGVLIRLVLSCLRDGQQTLGPYDVIRDGVKVAEVHGPSLKVVGPKEAVPPEKLSQPLSVMSWDWPQSLRALLALGLVVLGMLLSWGFYRIFVWVRNRSEGLRVASLRPPLVELERQIKRWTGEFKGDRPKPAFFGVSEALRRFLSRRFDRDFMELTTSELLRELEVENLVSLQDRNTLKDIMDELDRIKFTDQLPDGDRVRPFFDSVLAWAQTQEPKSPTDGSGSEGGSGKVRKP